eukprot:588266-Prymnesium_polylepis.1
MHAGPPAPRDGRHVAGRHVACEVAQAVARAVAEESRRVRVLPDLVDVKVIVEPAKVLGLRLARDRVGRVEDRMHLLPHHLREHRPAALRTLLRVPVGDILEDAHLVDAHPHEEVAPAERGGRRLELRTEAAAKDDMHS